MHNVPLFYLFSLIFPILSKTVYAIRIPIPTIFRQKCLGSNTCTNTYLNDVAVMCAVKCVLVKVCLYYLLVCALTKLFANDPLFYHLITANMREE